MNIATKGLWIVLIATVFGLVASPASPVRAQGANVFIVNSTGDDSDEDTSDNVCDTGGTVATSPECTLRAAIEQANATANAGASTPDEIRFDDIPTNSSDFATISPSPDRLPTITDQVIIDGTTAPDYGTHSTTRPIVIVRGNALSTGSDDGLRVNSGGAGSTILALAVYEMPDDGIQLTGDNVTIQDCHIGIEAGGGNARANGDNGITIFSNGNTIRSNVISGNTDDGIYFNGADNNVIRSNYIGTNYTGSAPVPNGENGVNVLSGTGNVIGSFTTGFVNLSFGNTISANGGAGIWLQDDAGNAVYANNIGTNSAGKTTTSSSTDDLGNGGGGIVVESDNNTIGPSGGRGVGSNVIGGSNSSPGIRIGNGSSSPVVADNNVVQYNYIGTTSAGVDLGNQDEGLRIDNGSGNTVMENVIAFSGDNGLEFRSGSNTALSNYIGTSASGADLGNTDYGVRLSSDNNTLDGNVIGANGDDGVNVSGNSNTIVGNYVGTDASDTNLGNGGLGIVVGGDNNDVGKNSSGSENVIGFNKFDGVRIYGQGNELVRNYIGTNSAGTDLGNGTQSTVANGITVFGDNNTIGGLSTAGNVIGFNSNFGVQIANASNAIVRGNHIGANSAGDDFGNGSNGIDIFASSSSTAADNIIGYSYSESVDLKGANIVGHNVGDGIAIRGSGTLTGNVIRGNRVYSNGGSGIDLGGDGTTANDGGDTDTGPNELQNFPEIQSVSHNSSTNEVSIDYKVTTNDTGSNYPLKVDFYAADSESGGEGKVYLGSQDYAAANTIANVSFDLDNFSNVTKDDNIVATATDADGNTSEFTSTATQLPVELVSFEATQSGDGAVRLTWKTASETNNAGFDVEHRMGETSFTKLGFIDGAGTTSEAQQYSFRAEDLDAGTHVFRLRQVDLDGTATYSKEVEIELTLDEAYVLTAPYPNPAHNQATVEFAVREAQPVTVALYNTLGQRVRTLYEGTPTAGKTRTVSLRGTTLTSGLYFVRMTGASFSTTETVTFVK